MNQNSYKQYKIRKISWNSDGAIYGISVPRRTGENFEEPKWTFKLYKTKNPIEFSGTFIVFQSGLDLSIFKENVQLHRIENYEVKHAKTEDSLVI